MIHGVDLELALPTSHSLKSHETFRRDVNDIAVVVSVPNIGQVLRSVRSPSSQKVRGIEIDSGAEALSEFENLQHENNHSWGDSTGARYRQTTKEPGSSASSKVVFIIFVPRTHISRRSPRDDYR